MIVDEPVITYSTPQSTASPYYHTERSRQEPIVEKISKGWRLTLVIIAAIETLLTSGIIFGWAPLVLILEKEGIYSDLCPEGQKTCDAQAVKLNLIYAFASSLFAISVWPTGAFLDKFGPRLSCMLGSFFFSGGFILFAISDTTPGGFDAFLPGFCLIAIGGPPIVFSFMHLSNLFPSKKATIITLFNVMLDASSLDFVVFQVLNEQFNISRRDLFLYYSAVPIVIFLSAVWIWPERSFLSAVTEDDTPVEAAVSHLGDDLEELSYWEQLKSTAFIAGTVFSGLQLLRVNFYIGTVGDQLDYAFPGDPDQSKLWTQIFGWVLPIGGILSIPLVGYLLDHRGLVTSIFVLNIAATAYGVTNLFEKSIYAQAATFAIFAFFRAFLFSGMSSYVASLFGFRNFGKLWGIIFLLSGCINIGEYFLVATIYKILKGNFFYPNLILTGLSGVCFLFPIWILWRWWRAQSNNTSYMTVSDDGDPSS